MGTASAKSMRMPAWLGAIAPLLLIGLLVAAFIAFDPIGELRSTPPVETLSFERTTLEPGSVELLVRNDGPDEVTIAQVLVNDAYWQFEVGERALGRLESTTVDIPYPWEPELPLNIAIVTSTGVTIEHEIEAAAETPAADGSTLLIYALLGLYIGVIPVAVGLLWFPALRNASKTWLGFFLAFTLGLLAFLLIDTLAEGFEIAGETGAALNGIGLFGIGAVLAVLGLLGLEKWLAGRRGKAASGLFLAYLVATGIGLHNLGEGLAVGAALAAGELALGTALILGFALHNTTEGLAIVAPLGSERARPPLMHFVGLGLVAGAPTILGAWVGGFAFAPAWGSLAFGIAAGAIAQVLWTIGRHMPSGRGVASGPGILGFVAGLLVMYVTGLFA
jgi:zinc transporter, ZIP family